MRLERDEIHAGVNAADTRVNATTPRASMDEGKGNFLVNFLWCLKRQLPNVELENSSVPLRHGGRLGACRGCSRAHQAQF